MLSFGGSPTPERSEVSEMVECRMAFVNLFVASSPILPVMVSSTGSGAVVEGEAVDVDETGALMIRAAGGIEAVRFGEVEHLE